MRLATRAAAIAALTFLFALAGGGPAATAISTVDPGAHALASPLLADVNDFLIESFDAEYELGRDDDGRSTLRTVERIVAVFPDFDQNRGLIRDIPRLYNGHETDVRVESVTDERGVQREFETERYGDFLSVTMAVPEGSFVHGAQTYVVTYTQRDVARLFEDTGADEFYWDVNGTDWSQPFGRVSARVTLAEELVPALTGQAACYRGAFGSSTPCEIDADGGNFTVEAHDLLPYENITLAIGFAPGTFSAAPVPFLERVPLLAYGGWSALAGALGLTIVTAWRGLRGAKTGRAIIAQYEPPERMSAALAAELVRARGKMMTATLLDLAVRRRIRLLHDEATDVYGAQAWDGSGLLPIEQSVWSRLFGSSRTTFSGGTPDPAAPDPGKTLWFDRTSTRLGDAAAALRGQAKAEAKKHGFVRRAPGGAVALIALLFVTSLGLFVLHAAALGNFALMTVLLAVGINLLVWLLIGISAALLAMRPRTQAGALAHDHLMGLREYIRLAEADRIRMLQSASGAEVDEQRIVQVYERLLPYAVIFGLEKEWQSELAKYYRESTPDWVSGSTTSTSFARALSISALSSAVSSSPVTRTSSGSGSGSSFSSSSGGSSGGGFSGGGGGGGGGRGI